MPGAPVSKTSFAGTAVLVRAGRTICTAMRYINEDSAIRFLQIFDAATAANVTVGTTIPNWILVAGANGEEDSFIGNGIVFENGLVVAGTTTALGSGAAASGTQHFFIVVE